MDAIQPVILGKTLDSPCAEAAGPDCTALGAALREQHNSSHDLSPFTKLGYELGDPEMKNFTNLKEILQSHKEETRRDEKQQQDRAAMLTDMANLASNSAAVAAIEQLQVAVGNPPDWMD